jgi:hypothetical protein
MASNTLKWWWYGLVEDLHTSCEKELRDLEDKECNKGHNWLTPQESLPSGWHPIAKVSLTKRKKLPIFGPYHCIWESPEHKAIRSRYAGKIFQRRISGIPPLVGVIGGVLGIVSFIMQLLNNK